LVSGALKEHLNIAPKVRRVDRMNPDTDLLAYVLGGFKKIHKEVPQWLFVTYGRAVFKVEGDINE